MGFCSKIHEYTCAAPNDNNYKGAFPDSEGKLQFNPVSTGTTQSCISSVLKIPGKTTQELEYFIVCGQNYNEIADLARFIRKADRKNLEEKTNYFWQNWLNPKTNIQFYEESDRNRLLETLYSRSLLILRTQTDKNGAITAANDSQFVKKGGKDSYSYMWPRDGAHTAMAYIEAGYPELAKNFFLFCEKVITKEGFMHHKYYSDVSKGIGSSWHPWVDKYGNEQLPIQEDETASVLIALNKYYQHYEDRGLITELWNSLIVPALNFLIDYRFLSNNLTDNHPIGFKLAGSMLPKPSYDIWEIHWGVHSYTVSMVYSALKAGAQLAESMKYEHLIESCTKAADGIKDAYEKYFFDEKDGTFINSIYCDPQHTKSRLDKMSDTSMHSLWMYGMFDVDDERIKKTIENIEKDLWLKTEVGGIARKIDDNYLQIDKSLPGNPWFISTLWMAQYYLKIGEKSKAKKYLDWVINHTDHTGLIAEQAHPHTGFGLSMKPLTWSHSEFVRTLNMI
jgi:GH15 family glucan-1,4-alpha-glucosidase